jgi:hypothetical protein
MRLPIRIFSDLTLRLGGASVQLTPRQSMHAAERLIRIGTRRMIIEEAGRVGPNQDRPAPRLKGTK